MLKLKLQNKMLYNRSYHQTVIILVNMDFPPENRLLSIVKEIQNRRHTIIIDIVNSSEAPFINIWVFSMIRLLKRLEISNKPSSILTLSNGSMEMIISLRMTLLMRFSLGEILQKRSRNWKTMYMVVNI